MKSQQTLTVSEVNRSIAAALAESFPEPFWVTAEIQGFDRDASKSSQRKWGQVYFELIEKEEGADSVKASVKSVLWGRERDLVQRKLDETSDKLRLQDGIQVKLLCALDFWWPRASLQLKVLDVDPTFTLGDMERARQDLIKHLKETGLFDRNRSQTFPVPPQNIGLITSDGSAAYHDFLEELKSSGFAFRVRFWDARMQGEETESSVCLGLRALESHPDVDVIALVRGGGSRSDLIWFDKKAVALAIANCSKPVVTGIGHEIDLSVADLTAHEHRKTPTAVAQFLVEKTREFDAELREAGARIAEESATLLGETKRELTQSFYLWQRLSTLMIGRMASDLAGTVRELAGASRRFLSLERERLSRAPTELNRGATETIRREKERLASFKKECVLKDPRCLLERGYSLIRSDGKILKSVGDVSAGREVEAQLKDGSFFARVQTVRKGDKS
jgi:exodeoxyribonuclease VII large subunit